MKSCKFKAFGQDWDLMVTNEDLKDPKTGESSWSLYDPHKNIVYVREIADKKKQQSSLLHELIHLVEGALGLNLSEGKVLCLEAGLNELIDFDLKK